MKLKKNNIILSYIIGFVTLLFGTLLVLLLIMKFTIGNKHYLYHLVESNDYYQLIYEEINEEMQNNLMSTGFTNEILDNLYTKEEVTEDINLFIENTYLGKETKLEKDNIKEKLDKNIEDFLKKSNLDVLNKKDLLLFEDEMINIYKNEITLYKMANKFIPKYNKLNKYINISLIITIITLIILFNIFRNIKIYSFGVITLGIGMNILFIRMAIYDRIDMDNVLIITEKFSQLLRIVLNYISNLLLGVAIVLGILGIFRIFTFSLRRKKRKVLKIDD